MASIAPSERLRRQLDEVIDGAGDEDDPIEAIGRFGARLIRVARQAVRQGAGDLCSLRR